MKGTMAEYAATPEERAGAIIAAECRGEIVREGTPHILQLDIDYPKYSPEYEKTLWRIARFDRAIGGGVLKVEYVRSKSGNCHLYVHMVEAMDPAEKAFWQAALGSDGTREILNLAFTREFGGDRNILFDPAESKPEVIELAYYR